MVFDRNNFYNGIGALCMIVIIKNFDFIKLLNCIRGA